MSKGEILWNRITSKDSSAELSSCMNVVPDPIGSISYQAIADRSGCPSVSFESNVETDKQGAEKEIEQATNLWLEAKKAFAEFKLKLQESEALFDKVEVNFHSAATAITESPTMRFLKPKLKRFHTTSETIADSYKEWQKGRKARKDEVENLFRQAIDDAYPKFKDDFEASAAEAYVPSCVESSTEASAAQRMIKEDDEQEAREAQA